MAKSFDALVNQATAKATRQRAAHRTRELLAEMPLSEIRRLVGMSQREMASMLGIRQPSLSKLENQSDMQVSTLKRIVEALGGELKIIARLPKGDVPLSQFGKAKRPTPKKPMAAPIT